jgi:PRTRC genetic system protein B
MNTSVSIGSCQDFRLSRVLLVYGTSSYNGFPFRHPFVTLHEVRHENEEAQLGEGRLVTPQMLADLMSEVCGAAAVEILPERVLARTPDMIAWWRPASNRTMFFSDRNGDRALKKLNGRKYPHPALLFKASASSLWVRALACIKRPRADTRLYHAPYWNCYDDGAVCTGSMMLPRGRSVSVMEQWEQSFFASEFTHAAGGGKRTRYPGGTLALWQSVMGRDIFPTRYLAPAEQTVEEWVTRHDRQNCNRNFNFNRAE